MSGGIVLREAASPAASTYEADGAEKVRALVARAAHAAKLRWKESNALVLRRGPYVVAAALDESIPDGKATLLKGHFVDLFDANLPVVSSVNLTPGKRALLFDLERSPATRPAVVAAACRISDEHLEGNNLHFRAEGFGSTEAVVLIASRRAPMQVVVGGKDLDASHYQVERGSLRLRFENTAAPISVAIRF
jgi:hypothetical protein